MGRAIAAVVGAFLLWTVLWLGFTSGAQAVFPDTIVPEQPLTHTGALLGYLLYSVAISITAGFVCAAIRQESAMTTVMVFAAIQLVVGIGFEASYWDMTPVWYHVSFLLLIVPATAWGGTLRVRRQAVRAR